MTGETRTIYSIRRNKGISSLPEECLSVQWPKRCKYSNEDKDHSLNNANNVRAKKIEQGILCLNS